jgi:hypothetical protein
MAESKSDQGRCPERHRQACAGALIKQQRARHTDEAPGLPAVFFELRIPQPVDGFFSKGNLDIPSRQLARIIRLVISIRPGSRSVGALSQFPKDWRLTPMLTRRPQIRSRVIARLSLFDWREVGEMAGHCIYCSAPRPDGASGV